AVDKLSGEELEDDQLGGEQDHESGDQRPRSQEGHVREKSSKLVRGKGWDRELGRRPSRRLGKLVDDHRREHHAEERTDEENPPLVVEQVSEPTTPPRGGLRRVAEYDSRCPDLFPLPDPERLDGGKLRRSPRAAEDEREEAFARSLRPTSPDECKVEQEHREGCPEPETGGHAAEGDDGSFTGCEGETPDFDVVEDLEDGGDEDDPPDADEAGRGPAHGTRADEPLAAPDGNAERDHARTEDVQEELLRADP